MHTVAVAIAVCCRNVVLYPLRIVNSVKVLFAEVRGNGDDGVSFLKLGGELLHGGQDRSGTSADEQVTVSNKREARVNRFFFTYGDDPIRFREFGELRLNARSDAGDISLSGPASERNRTRGLDRNHFDARIYLMKPLGNTAKCARCSRPYKGPIDDRETL